MIYCSSLVSHVGRVSVMHDNYKLELTLENMVVLVICICNCQIQF